MTTPYPAEYYYPEFIENRSDDPNKPPPPRPPLTSAVTATTSQRQSTKKKKEPVNLAINVVTNQGLPDVDITRSTQNDPKKSLIRNPNEKNIPRLIVHDNIILQGVYSPRNFDEENNESNQIANKDSPNKTEIQTRPIEYNTQHYLVPIIVEQIPVDEYWKQEVAHEALASTKPITYDKSTYEGPFGLSRRNGTIYYISVGIITFLAATFLIITGVFYANSYPNSSSKTAEIAGIGICAFAFYFGLQLILIGIWQQKTRQENPSKKISKTKKSAVHNDSTDYLKTSMEDNEQYDYSFQQVDNTPYGYHSNPPYVSNVNEQILLQQPGAATGAAYYEPVVWPSNVEIETQPDAKFLQPMDWSYGPQTLQSSADITTSPTLQSSNINPTNNRKLLKKNNKTMPTKTVEAEQSIVEFDDIQLKSSVIEQPLPNLAKAPETYDLIKSIAQMEQSSQSYPINGDLSTKKSHRLKHTDSKTEVSFADDDDDDNHRHRHHHHHRRHHHHHRPEHRRHHSHHSHHQQHRRRSHRSLSPCPECLRNAHNTFHPEHNPHHHHHHFQHSEPLPRVITPHLPKIITPTPMRFERTIFRDTGINTGYETKIMRDSSVTADLEDVPNLPDNRFGQIPVIRRTIIVEPYPAQPSSQIIVKPRADMIGKIRLGKNTTIDGENETIVYPSTAFMTKKTKKKKRKTIVNNIMIEDLQLEDVNNDDESIKTRKSKPSKTSRSKTIKNAFYN